MADFTIESPYSPAGDQPAAIASLVDGVRDNKRDQTLLGVTGSGKTFTMANVIQSVQKQTLIISHNKTLAAQLYGEMKALFPNNAVEYFISYYDYYQPEAYMPVTDTYIEKDSSINEQIDKLRLRATSSLMSRDDVIIVASVSCIYGIGSPKSYSEMVLEISRGSTLDRKRFFKELIAIHYVRNDQVLEPGRFRVLGDIVEIFPPYEDHAIRLDFFGDEVEDIAPFDPLTGQVEPGMERVSIFPVKHFVTSDEHINNAIALIKDELSDRLDQLKENGQLLEAQRLEQRTLYDVEMMLELGFCSGIENYSRHIDGRKKGERPYTLIDFFSDDFLLILDESHVTLPQLRAMYNGDRSRKQTLVEHGFRLPSALDNRPMDFDEFVSSINQVIYVSATPGDYEIEKSNGVSAEQIIRPTGLLDPIIEHRDSDGQIEDIIFEIKKVLKRDERVLITTLTKRMSEDLTSYLKGVGIRAEYMHSEIDTIERIKILRGLRLASFDVLVGVNLLREGLDLPEVSLVVVIDADKEGFLRSKSSLLQVAGRTARNVNGKVILYGMKESRAMRHLMDTTEERRKIQQEYNTKHGIVPRTIKKSIEDIESTTSVADHDEPAPDKVTESFDEKLFAMIDDESNIAALEEKMHKYAKEYKFEEAAMIRDKINSLQN